MNFSLYAGEHGWFFSAQTVTNKLIKIGISVEHLQHVIWVTLMQLFCLPTHRHHVVLA